MTDNFEKAQQRILKEARANGGVTTDHLLDALIATNEDLDAQHTQTIKWHKSVSMMVAEHIEESKVRDERLDKHNERLIELESTAEAGPELVKAYVEGYVDAEHAERHGAYVASLRDRQSKVAWFFATAVGRAALVLFGLVAGIVLNVLVYGRP